MLVSETNKDWLSIHQHYDTAPLQTSTTIRQFGTDLATPITCNENENGVFNCTGGN